MPTSPKDQHITTLLADLSQRFGALQVDLFNAQQEVTKERITSAELRRNMATARSSSFFAGVGAGVLLAVAIIVVMGFIAPVECMP